MNNTILRVFIVASLVLFGSLYYYSGQVEEHYQENASRYLDQALTEISSWQAADLKSQLAAETLQQVGDSQLQQLVEHYRQLGRYQSMDTPQLSRLSAALSLFNEPPRLSYSSRVQFAQGSAAMTATLTLEKQRFKFYNFNLGELENPQPAATK